MRYLLNYARFREKLCSEVSLTSCLVNSMLNREGVDETKLAKGGVFNHISHGTSFRIVGPTHF